MTNCSHSELQYVTLSISIFLTVLVRPGKAQVLLSSMWSVGVKYTVLLTTRQVVEVVQSIMTNSRRLLTFGWNSALPVLWWDHVQSPISCHVPKLGSDVYWQQGQPFPVALCKAPTTLFRENTAWICCAKFYIKFNRLSWHSTVYMDACKLASTLQWGDSFNILALTACWIFQMFSTMTWRVLLGRLCVVLPRQPLGGL